MMHKTTSMRFLATIILIALLFALGGCSFVVVDERPPEAAAATQTARANAIPAVTVEPSLLPTVTPDFECPIKGNVSRTGEKIYHLPGQANYDQVVIDPDHGETYFCDEETAVANGWRKAQR